MKTDYRTYNRPAMGPRRLFILALSMLAFSSVGADTIYKTVDADGRVTYSSTPPPPTPGESIEQVAIEPGPSEEQIQETEQRLKALETATAKSEKQSKAQEEKSATSTAGAQKTLDDARIALEEAKLKGDDDWQTLSRGGRVLKQSYLDRVKDAEERVKEAETGLRSAGRSKP